MARRQPYLLISHHIRVSIWVEDVVVEVGKEVVFQAAHHLIHVLPDCDGAYYICVWVCVHVLVCGCDAIVCVCGVCVCVVCVCVVCVCVWCVCVCGVCVCVCGICVSETEVQRHTNQRHQGI